jgi:hypothetical protein
MGCVAHPHPSHPSLLSRNQKCDAFFVARNRSCNPFFSRQMNEIYQIPSFYWLLVTLHLGLISLRPTHTIIPACHPVAGTLHVPWHEQESDPSSRFV